MTYAEYIPRHTDTPEDLISCVQIHHNTRNGWYNAYGKWHGQTIRATAPQYSKLLRMIRERYFLQIPARKSLIFSRQTDGLRIALVQGYLPGSAVVDMSEYKPRKTERSCPQ